MSLSQIITHDVPNGIAQAVLSEAGSAIFQAGKNLRRLLALPTNEVIFNELELN